MLARDLAVDLEPETRTGSSTQTTAIAYDRVCSGSLSSLTTLRSRLGLCLSRSRFRMEGRSLLRQRFHDPARWDTPLSSQPGASGPGAASRNRWKPARRVCG